MGVRDIQTGPILPGIVRGVQAYRQGQQALEQGQQNLALGQERLALTRKQAGTFDADRAYLELQRQREGQTFDAEMAAHERDVAADERTRLQGLLRQRLTQAAPNKAGVSQALSDLRREKGLQPLIDSVYPFFDDFSDRDAAALRQRFLQSANPRSTPAARKHFYSSTGVHGFDPVGGQAYTLTDEQGRPLQPPFNATQAKAELAREDPALARLMGIIEAPGPKDWMKLWQTYEDIIRAKNFYLAEDEQLPTYDSVQAFQAAHDTAAAPAPPARPTRPDTAGAWPPTSQPPPSRAQGWQAWGTGNY